MTEKTPSQAQIEAAARMLCYLNGIPECCGDETIGIPPCTPTTCPHGMRDFAKDAYDVARAVVNADGERGAKEGK